MAFCCWCVRGDAWPVVWATSAELCAGVLNSSTAAATCKKTLRGGSGCEAEAGGRGQAQEKHITGMPLRHCVRHCDGSGWCSPASVGPCDPTPFTITLDQAGWVSHIVIVRSAGRYTSRSGWGTPGSVRQAARQGLAQVGSRFIECQFYLFSFPSGYLADSSGWGRSGLGVQSAPRSACTRNGYACSM